MTRARTESSEKGAIRPASGTQRKPRISIVVAMARNRVIGRDGKLPWHISDDLKRFRSLTMGHHIIMGRRTFESIGRLLPGRTTVIVTRQQDFSVTGAITAHSLEDAVRRAAGDSEIFIIGGAELYRDALAIADRILLTDVHADVPGDVLFPRMTASDWHETARESRPSARPGEPAFDYVILERRR